MDLATLENKKKVLFILVVEKGKKLAIPPPSAPWK